MIEIDVVGLSLSTGEREREIGTKLPNLKNYILDVVRITY